MSSALLRSACHLWLVKVVRGTDLDYFASCQWARLTSPTQPRAQDEVSLGREMAAVLLNGAERSIRGPLIQELTLQKGKTEAQRGEESNLVDLLFFWHFKVLPSPCQHVQTYPVIPAHVSPWKLSPAACCSLTLLFLILSLLIPEQYSALQTLPGLSCLSCIPLTVSLLECSPHHHCLIKFYSFFKSKRSKLVASNPYVAHNTQGFFLFFCSTEASFENIRYNEKTASQVALVVKNLFANVGELGLIPGSGRSPGRGHRIPLQYSCLENPMDRAAWWATVYRAAKVSDVTKAP